MKKEVPVWTTKEGQEIPIPDLTDSHLKNIVAMLRRNAASTKEWAVGQGYLAEASIHGEMALDSIQSTIMHLEEQDPQEYIEEEFPEIFEEYYKRFGEQEAEAEDDEHSLL